MAGGKARMEYKYPHLFSPIKVGRLTLKNRIEAAPVNISNLPISGYPTAENIAIFEGKAKGGAAIVHMGECRIDMKTGISHKLCIALDDPEVLPYLHAATDAIKKHNAFAAGGLRPHPPPASAPVRSYALAAASFRASISRGTSMPWARAPCSMFSKWAAAQPMHPMPKRCSTSTVAGYFCTISMMPISFVISIIYYLLAVKLGEANSPPLV